MLVRFNVKNFLSFSDREDPADSEKRISHEFSMLPGSVRNKEDHVMQSGKLRLLRFAAIYGANAAGKSNIIKAIQAYRQIVLTGTVSADLSQMYCKTEVENKDRPSYFEAEFVIDDDLYAYGFEVVLSRGTIISEWLYRINPNSEKRIFEKTEEMCDYAFDSELKDLTDLKVIEKSFSGSNTLFLSFLNRNMAGFFRLHRQALTLQKVFSWFANMLSVNFPDYPIQDSSFLFNKANLKEISSLLKAFGTGIKEVYAEDVDFKKVEPFINRTIFNEALQRRDELSKSLKENKQDTKANKVSLQMIVKNRSNFYIIFIGEDNESIRATELKFTHEFDAEFPFGYESDGTQRLFDLLEILLNINNKVYILDELDRRLHPCLTYEFVKTFFKYSKDRNVQFIVTSHESRLLDFDLLRRDEIWFVEKDKKGESYIYSLEQYNERFDKKIDKAYLEGRYGGVPIFTALFPIDKQIDK